MNMSKLKRIFIYIGILIAATITVSVGIYYYYYQHNSYKAANVANRMNETYIEYLQARARLGENYTYEAETSLCIELEKKLYGLINAPLPTEILTNENWLARWVLISEKISEVLPTGKHVLFCPAREGSPQRSYIRQWYGDYKTIRINSEISVGNDSSKKEITALFYIEDPTATGRIIREYFIPANTPATRVSEQLIAIDGYCLKGLTGNYIKWGQELRLYNLTPKAAFNQLIEGTANQKFSALSNQSQLTAWAYLAIGNTYITNSETEGAETALANDIFRSYCIHEMIHDYIRTKHNEYSDADGENIASGAEMAYGALPLNTLRALQFNGNGTSLLPYIAGKFGIADNDTGDVTSGITEDKLRTIALQFLATKNISIKVNIEYSRELFAEIFRETRMI